MNRRYVAITALTIPLVVGAVFFPSLAADATPEPKYVTAVWSASGTDQWPVEGQTLASSRPSDILDVDFIKAEAAKLGCGFTIQGDLYADDKTTAALLEGGKLFAPNKPAESWPDGKYKAEYSTVFYTGDCPIEPTPTSVRADLLPWSCADGAYTDNAITYQSENADVTVTKDGVPFVGPLNNLVTGVYELTFTAHAGFAIEGQSVFTFDLVQPTEGCLDPCDLEASNCNPVEPPVCDPTQQACAEVPADPTCDPNKGECMATTGVESDAAILAGVLAILGAALVVWARINRRKNLITSKEH